MQTKYFVIRIMYWTYCPSVFYNKYFPNILFQNGTDVIIEIIKPAVVNNVFKNSC